jgi:glycosyltransferase involved in cell wall biosynthesis
MKGKDYLLSIIVPAYNVDEFIGDCINSIFDNNNLKEQVQLVIINDGSTDNTLKIVEEKTRYNNDITFISLENSGVSVARNTGFEQSNGKYIWFVDPDDILEKGAIELILN